MTEDRVNNRKSNKLWGANHNSSSESASHVLARVEPITKLKDNFRFTKTDLLCALHVDMKNERELVEAALQACVAPGCPIDYTPLSEIAIKHARRAELVTAMTADDLEAIEELTLAICDGRIGELEEQLRLVEYERIDILSEGLRLALRTDTFWIGAASGWLHFINKESGRYFSYPMGAIDLYSAAEEQRVEKNAS